MAEIIDHLQRAYDTRLYAVRGHSSLFVYLVKELGYSEAAAYRRVNAVKLVKELPSIREDMQMGRLHLNTLADAAASHQCTVLFSEDEMKVIQRLKEIYPQKTLSEILILTAREHVQRHDPQEKAKRIVMKSGQIQGGDSEKSLGDDSEPAAKIASKTIPARVKHLVRVRDQGQCCYKDPQTGQICGSRSALEFDHIQPQALGGEHRVDNLQALCRTHNLLRAHGTFPEKVNIYWQRTNH